jgi:uracil-DNA glycosylase
MLSPADLSPLPNAEASRDCPLCPRLVTFRQDCRAEHPDWWNAPVPAFGDPQAWLAIIGLAPGKHGANRTGGLSRRPCRGAALRDAGEVCLSEGEYDQRRDDGLRLKGRIILNAVKCLPPQTRHFPRGSHLPPVPDGSRSQACHASPPSLRSERWRMTVCAEASACPWPARNSRIGATHDLSPQLRLIDSYHCSRYNQNTKRLDAAMFEAVFAQAVEGRSS